MRSTLHTSASRCIWTFPSVCVVTLEILIVCSSCFPASCSMSHAFLLRNGMPSPHPWAPVLPSASTQCRRSQDPLSSWARSTRQRPEIHVAVEMENESAGLRASEPAAESMSSVGCGGDTDRAVTYEPAGTAILLTRFLVPVGHLICRASCSARFHGSLEFSGCGKDAPLPRLGDDGGYSRVLDL